MSYMNRLGNAKNEYQGKIPKILCICSAGLLRSPTIAWVLSQAPYEFNTRAAGCNKEYALIYADDVLIHWADIIICADQDHADSLNLDDSKPVYVLNLPDSYSYRDNTLISIIQEKLQKIDFTIL